MRVWALAFGLLMSLCGGRAEASTVGFFLDFVGSTSENVTVAATGFYSPSWLDFHSGQNRIIFNLTPLVAVTDGDPSVGSVQFTGMAPSRSIKTPGDYLQLFSDGTWLCEGVCQFERNPLHLFPWPASGEFLLSGTYTVRAVAPIPGTLPLMLSAIGLFALLRWRQNQPRRSMKR